MLAESCFEAELRLVAHGSFTRGGRAAGPGTRSVTSLPAGSGAQDTVTVRVGAAAPGLSAWPPHHVRVCTCSPHTGPVARAPAGLVPRLGRPGSGQRPEQRPLTVPASRCASLELADPDLGPQKLRGSAAEWGSRRPTPHVCPTGDALMLHTGKAGFAKLSSLCPNSVRKITCQQWPRMGCSRRKCPSLSEGIS